MRFMVFAAPLVWALTAFGFTNSIGMKFVEIPAGSFMMGTKAPECPKDNPFTSQNEYEDCMNSISRDETPQHKVTLKGFYMQTTEVTQGQWYAIMGDNPAVYKTGNPDMPVENVTYRDALAFIKKLNAQEKTDKYRLPTEAEWEYAARAGTTTAYSFGNDRSQLGQYAWFDENSGRETHPVGTKKPNPWGLYDMHGNVWEWTGSCYTKDYNSGCDGGRISYRGGSWGRGADDLRSAVRNSSSRPDSRIGSLGFRLSRTK